KWPAQPAEQKGQGVTVHRAERGSAAGEGCVAAAGARAKAVGPLTRCACREERDDQNRNDSRAASRALRAPGRRLRRFVLDSRRHGATSFWRRKTYASVSVARP